MSWPQPAIEVLPDSLSVAAAHPQSAGARRVIRVFVDQFAMEMAAEEHRRRREAHAAHARRLALFGRDWSLKATIRILVSGGQARRCQRPPMANGELVLYRSVKSLFGSSYEIRVMTLGNTSAIPLSLPTGSGTPWEAAGSEGLYGARGEGRR